MANIVCEKGVIIVNMSSCQVVLYLTMLHYADVDICLSINRQSVLLSRTIHLSPKLSNFSPNTLITMSTNTSTSHESANKATPRKPRTTPDLNKYFCRNGHRDLLVICNYCGSVIAAEPTRERNFRRRAHLEECAKFEKYVNDYKAFKQIVLHYNTNEWTQWKEIYNMDDDTSEDEEDKVSSNFPELDNINQPDEHGYIISNMMINILLAYVFLKFIFYQS